MKLEFELVEKSFKTAEGENLKYYVLQYKLSDGSTLELPVKSDKAKLLKLSNSISSTKDFWEK